MSGKQQFGPFAGQLASGPVTIMTTSFEPIIPSMTIDGRWMYLRTSWKIDVSPATSIGKAATIPTSAGPAEEPLEVVSGSTSVDDSASFIGKDSGSHELPLEHLQRVAQLPVDAERRVAS